MSASALQVARTGLEAQDTRMRVIANNLANVATTAFKRDRASFATLSYQDVRIAGQQSTSQNNFATGLNLGTGVAIQGTSRMEQQGTLDTTGNAFDIAIQGEGYFQVLLPSGVLAYTRAGNLSLSGQGEIQTSDGYPLQPSITVPTNTTTVSIGTDGTVTAMVAGSTTATQIGQITTATFINPAGFRRWAATSCRKPPAAAPPRSASRANRTRHHHAGRAGNLQREHRDRAGRHDRMPARL
jgi:flagellar basal-body rod protein FlgG